MARGFDDINPKSGGNDRLKPEELWDIFPLAKEATSWTNFRFLPGDMLPVKIHWIKIRAGKDKRETKIPKLCVTFDPDNESVPLEGEHCPYCELSGGQDGSCQTSTAYYANVIVRDIQDNEPRKKSKPTASERKSGMKDLNSKTWTPVRVIRIPQGLAAKLKDLKQRNKQKGEYWSISDKKYGMDVGIKYDPDATGGDRYQVDRGEPNALEADELEYLVYDLGVDAYDKMGRESSEQAAAEFKKLDIIGADVIDDDDDGDDLPSRRGRKSKSDDDDDDDTPRRRRRRSSSDDDDDDDDAPRKRRKKGKTSDDDAPRKRRRSSLDDDDDDDDDAPRTRRKRRSSIDDDEPPRKRRTKTSSAKKSRTKRSRR